MQYLITALHCNKGRQACKPVDRANRQREKYCNILSKIKLVLNLLVPYGCKYKHEYFLGCMYSAVGLPYRDLGITW